MVRDAACPVELPPPPPLGGGRESGWGLGDVVREVRAEDEIIIFHIVYDEACNLRRRRRRPRLASHQIVRLIGATSPPFKKAEESLLPDTRV